MKNPQLEQLIEAEMMRTVMTAVKALSERSEGVMIDGSVVTWDEAIPLIKTIPSGFATSEMREDWMKAATEKWHKDYHDRVTTLTARKLSENSTTENDNVYLWSLLNAATTIISDLLKRAEKKTFEDRPDLLSAAENTLTALNAVRRGSVSTARVHQSVFINGMDNVLMEFQMLLTQARINGSKEDEIKYLHAVNVISSLRQATIQSFPD